tara:strand:+ start:2698 stop:2955 length:258 start_codon:yes stop_codon:yes gene_type:complete
MDWKKILKYDDRAYGNLVRETMSWVEDTFQFDLWESKLFPLLKDMGDMPPRPIKEIETMMDEFNKLTKNYFANSLSKDFLESFRS